MAPGLPRSMQNSADVPDRAGLEWRPILRNVIGSQVVAQHIETGCRCGR